MCELPGTAPLLSPYMRSAALVATDTILRKGLAKSLKTGINSGRWRKACIKSDPLLICVNKGLLGHSTPVSLSIGSGCIRITTTELSSCNIDLQTVSLRFGSQWMPDSHNDVKAFTGGDLFFNRILLVGWLWRRSICAKEMDILFINHPAVAGGKKRINFWFFPLLTHLRLITMVLQNRCSKFYVELRLSFSTIYLVLHFILLCFLLWIFKHTAYFFP